MKLTLCSVLALALLAALPAAHAQEIIASWSLTGEPGSQVSTAGTGAVSISATDLLRGADLNPNAGTNSINASGWDAGDDRYFSFGFSVDAGFQANLSQLLVNTQSSSTGPRNFVLRSSLDGFTADLAVWQNTTTATNFSVNLTGLPPIAGSVEFRIISSDNTSVSGGAVTSTGTSRISNYTGQGFLQDAIGFTGSITAVGDPLPAPVAEIFFPAPNALDVPVDSNFSVTFSRPVAAGTGTIQVFDSANNLVESVSVPSAAVSVSGSTLEFALSADLDFSEGYYVLLDEGIVVSQVGGTASEALADPLVWSFATEGPDIGPEIIGLSPPTATSGLAIPEALVIEFDRDVFENFGFISIYRSDDDSLVADFSVEFFDFEVSVSGNRVEVDLSSTPLDPGTSYYVEIDTGAFFDQSFIEFVGLFGKTGPDSWFFTTGIIPGISNTEDYTEDFTSFISPGLLPSGWSLSGPVTTGPSPDGVLDIAQFPWGEGFNAGTRGEADVLGYQHTGTTGTLQKILTLRNDTGAELTQVSIAFVGRAERLAQTRSPEYTVTVAGIPSLALGYSTVEGDGQLKASTISGLSVPDGETFQIIWTSSGNVGTAGARKQIGISSVFVTTGTIVTVPSLAAPVVPVETITQTSATAESSFNSDGGAAVSERGFVISEAGVNPAPQIGGTGVTQLIDPATGILDFSAGLTGLQSGTLYAVRAYGINSEGTGYSPVTTFRTAFPAPSLVDIYVQPFDNYTGVVPGGWSAVSSGGVSNYIGAWGSGTAGGFRGGETDPGVLGYQHTSGSGTLTVTLTLKNETGGTINQLTVSYLGRVARVDQTRLPAWTVRVNGTVFEDLAYSTGEGADREVSAIVTGLNILPGEDIVISWSSDRGLASGASRQIGLANVEVDATPPALASPILSLDAGTYFSDQVVFVSNFASYPVNTEIRFTTDGSIPSAINGSIYNDATGIALLDGAGPRTLRAVAVDLGTEDASAVTARTYAFPLNVADLATLRAQTAGTPALYRVTGQTTFIAGTAFRNTKFFQDESEAGIQIDDTPGLVETIYNPGENITGLVGTIGVFQNQLQFVPAQDPGPALSTGNPLTVVDRTLDTLTEADQSRLVRLTGIVFDAGDGVAVFGGGGTVSALTDQSANSGTFRNVFGDSDITGAIIPDELVDIVGIIQEHGTSAPTFRSIASRSLADITPSGVTPPSGGSFAGFMDGFFPGETNPDIIGLFANPSGDGIPNILKYFYGADPRFPSQGLRQVASDGSGLTFEFTRNRNLGDDIVAEYQWSADLSDWFASGSNGAGLSVTISEQVIDDTDPDVQVIQLTATITEGATDDLFLRIEASETVVEAL